MSVYSDAHVLHFERAVKSLLAQTALPDEIIIAIDGPIGGCLESSVKTLCTNKIIKAVKLNVNVGPGMAKHRAILLTKNPLIAIMDADDIALPRRFEKQLNEFLNEDIDVVGGFIEEFSDQPEDTGIIREVPINIDDILEFTKRRNPINHVTLMFKKRLYQEVGGYTSKRHAEDWELILKMLYSGAVIRNLSEVLVHVRAGTVMLGKRKRISILKDRINIFFLMYRLDFINSYYLLTNILTSFSLIVLPKVLLQLIYRVLLRRKKINT